MRKCWLPAFSPFPHTVFKRPLSQECQNSRVRGKVLKWHDNGRRHINQSYNQLVEAARLTLSFLVKLKLRCGQCRSRSDCTECAVLFLSYSVKCCVSLFCFSFV